MPERRDLLVLFYTTMWGATCDLPSAAEVQYTTDRTRYSESDVVIFHIPTLHKLRSYFLPKKLPHQIWIGWSLECEQNYRLLRSAEFMKKFDLLMSYKLSSDIPLPYIGFYGLADEVESKLRIAPGPKDPGCLVSAHISSSINQSRRQQYLRELSKYIQVDSYGSFMRNKLETERTWASKNATISRYKFTIAFENSIGVDYVTEKFFDPLIAGSLPVYLGAPNIRDFAPGNHSFINTQDFSNPKALADYLLYLAEDDQAYDRYFTWKQDRFPEPFSKMLAQVSDTTGNKLYKRILIPRFTVGQESERCA